MSDGFDPRRISGAPEVNERGSMAWMARNPVAANLLMVAFLVGGLLMSFRIKKEVFPQIQLDEVDISVPYPGASPAEVEQGVLLAVEEAVRAKLLATRKKRPRICTPIRSRPSAESPCP